jgi:hypothetical protein
MRLLSNIQHRFLNLTVAIAWFITANCSAADGTLAQNASESAPASRNQAKVDATDSATAQGETHDFSTDEVDAAIAKGLRYLLSKQREDGAIVDRQYDTTMTSLAIMALASTGHLPTDRDRYGKASERALTFVLQDDRHDANGYYGNRDGSRMYGHGITTLMLTELSGMGGHTKTNIKLEEKCELAIQVILSAQARKKSRDYQGGWRYTPSSNDSDLSVTTWQLMALRSAKNDGMAIPDAAISSALAYLQASYTGPSPKRVASPSPLRSTQIRPAGFSYLPTSRTPSFAMTAAGLLALQVCGDYNSPMVQASTRWLETHPPKWRDRYFFYGLYYYSQAVAQQPGETGQKAQELVAKLLLEHQGFDGSWASTDGEEAGVGKVYATSLAILALSVKYHYLPIYQR